VEEWTPVMGMVMRTYFFVEELELRADMMETRFNIEIRCTQPQLKELNDNEDPYTGSGAD
jgi:hypothetical protein